MTCSPSLTCSRNFWETFPFFGNTVHLKDGLDRKRHQLVYRCQLFNYAFYAQFVSLCTFAAQGIYGPYYAYQSMVHNTEPLSQFSGFSVTYDLIGFAILGLFTMQNIAMYYLAQRMLLRAYYKEDTDEYVFVSLSSNPFKSRLTYCKPGDMNPLFRNNLLAMFGNFKIKDRKFFVRYNKFQNLMHFNRLLSEPVECE